MLKTRNMAFAALLLLSLSYFALCFFGTVGNPLLAEPSDFLEIMMVALVCSGLAATLVALPSVAAEAAFFGKKAFSTVCLVFSTALAVSVAVLFSLRDLVSAQESFGITIAPDTGDVVFGLVTLFVAAMTVMTSFCAKKISIREERMSLQENQQAVSTID